MQAIKEMYLHIFIGPNMQITDKDNYRESEIDWNPTAELLKWGIFNLHVILNPQLWAE